MNAPRGGAREVTVDVADIGRGGGEKAAAPAFAAGAWRATYFVVLGDPVGKGRPRVTVIAGHAHAYTPAKTRSWEASAAAAFATTWGAAPLDEAVHVVIQAVAARPKRLLRKRDPAGRLWRTTKPDADNVAKAVGDALVAAGVLRDDALVVRLEVESLYARKDEGPAVHVWLRPAGRDS